jgi:hypothetical protein
MVWLVHGQHVVRHGAYQSRHPPTEPNDLALFITKREGLGIFQHTTSQFLSGRNPYLADDRKLDFGDRTGSSQPRNRRRGIAQICLADKIRGHGFTFDSENLLLGLVVTIGDRRVRIGLGLSTVLFGIPAALLWVVTRYLVPLLPAREWEPLLAWFVGGGLLVALLLAAAVLAAVTILGARSWRAVANTMQGVSIEALHKGFRDAGVKNNEVIVFSGLMDAKSLFLTPNADTVYVMSMLDLSKGPMVLERVAR